MFNNNRNKGSNNSNNSNNSRIRLKRTTSFFISYSLIFNNLLYASLPIVVSDNNKETKVYYDSKEDKEI